MVFKKGQRAWNKGRSADPDSPNYDSRVAKYVRAHVGKPSGALGKTWKWSDESRARQSERMTGKTPWNKDKTKETHPSLKQLGETLSERIRNSPLLLDSRSRAGRMNKGREPWNKDLTKETDERVAKYAKTLQIQWAGLSDEERAKRIGAIMKALLEYPNNEEKRLQRVLKPYGYLFNFGEFVLGGYSNIYNRTRSVYPDLYHPNIPVVIQNDGWLGHDPKSWLTPDNVGELDDERDEICCENDYAVIRVTPKDHKNSDELLLELIRDRLNVFGYSLKNNKK